MQCRFHRLSKFAIATVCAVATAIPVSSTQTLANGDNVWWVATTGTTNTTLGNGSSCSDPDKVGTTSAVIQETIEAATAGDEIRICSGTYAVASTITISKNVRLVGVGSSLPILDGQNARRIMFVDGVGTEVSLDLLHFRNGFDSVDQGGGAIRVSPKAILNVEQSLFVNNKARGAGGAISMLGDETDNGLVNVNRSTFYRNQALGDGSDAGAIAIIGVRAVSDPRSVISNSTFVENSAHRNGGAINASFAYVALKNSTLIDNQATAGGQAVWSVQMMGNLIANTSAINPDITSCLPENGHSPVENISTDASCVGSGNAVTYSSLNINFLAPWGGPVPTVSLNSGSTAIDTVTGTRCALADQRNIQRGTTCTAGAFEFVSNAPSISAASASPIAILTNTPVVNAPTFTASNFSSNPTFRVAIEINGPLPNGVTTNAANGSISGTPDSSYLDSYFIISASDTNQNVASARVLINNCNLPLVNGSFQISNSSELEVFEIGFCGLDANFQQTANIAWNNPWNSSATSTSPFTGSYDGGGYSISGLQMNSSGAGFIAYTSNASISNLTISVTAIGNSTKAGLISGAGATTINNVHVSGTVENTASNFPLECVGGLVGDTYLGTVLSNTSFTGSVTTQLNYIGGLIGCAYDLTRIEDSFFDGDVSGVLSIGGLVGWNAASSIERSRATGSVQGTSDIVGGLVGELASGSAITKSFFEGTTTGDDKVGGLVGYLDGAEIDNSYVRGTVSGSGTHIGGIAGYVVGDNTTDGDTFVISHSFSSAQINPSQQLQSTNLNSQTLAPNQMVGALMGYGPSDSIDASYWEALLNGVEGLNPIGELNGSGEQPTIAPISAETMKTFAFFHDANWNIFDGWESAATSQKIWGICSDSVRPFLLWQHTSTPCPTSQSANDTSASPQSGTSQSSGSAPTSTVSTGSNSSIARLLQLPVTGSSTALVDIALLLLLAGFGFNLLHRSRKIRQKFHA